MRRRPIMTAGHLKPSYYNPPLPRLKPQPLHITGMIVNRKRARSRRLDALEQWKQVRQDLMEEYRFETYLATMHPSLLRDRCFTENTIGDWSTQELVRFLSLTTRAAQIAKDHFQTISSKLDRDTARLEMRYTPQMLEMIRRARTEKIRNKTHERERERRGEVLKRTVKRLSRMPPARVWSTLTPQQRANDALARMPKGRRLERYLEEARHKIGLPYSSLRANRS